MARLPPDFCSHYCNKGQRPVILYKESNVIPNFQIAFNENGLKSGQYDINAQDEITFIGEQFEVNLSNLKKIFIILEPQESFETKAHLNFSLPLEYFFAYQNQKANNTHFLQITVSTWPYLAKTDPKKLAKECSSMGDLIWSGVTSLPISLKPDKLQNIEKCPLP